MTVVLNGLKSIEDVVNKGEMVLVVSDDSWERIEKCRNMIQVKIDSHEITYGKLNNCIGEFSSCSDSEHQRTFMLIYSHAAGIGEITGW